MRPITAYPFRKASCRRNTKKGDAEIALHMFVFKNRKGTTYIVNVEQFLYDVFIVKFHTKQLSHSKEKYNRLTNEKDARKIIYTCIEIGLSIYKDFPLATFGFIGSPLPNEKERENELLNTKRFKVYKKFAAFFFSPDNFDHSTNPNFSSYILFNKKHIEANPCLKENIMSMFENHFDMEELMGIANN